VEPLVGVETIAETAGAAALPLIIHATKGSRISTVTVFD
jgi:hypothetical protein